MLKRIFAFYQQQKIVLLPQKVKKKQLFGVKLLFFERFKPYIEMKLLQKTESVVERPKRDRQLKIISALNDDNDDDASKTNKSSILKTPIKAKLIFLLLI